MILAMFKRFLGRNPGGSRSQESGRRPEEVVILIQEGDQELRNSFIADYQPFIAKTTSRFCSRYINPGVDDEFSVALSAFNEAINQYMPSAGKSFLGFAETVIRRRLIDHLRKEQRHVSQIPMSSFEREDEEDHVVNPVEVRQAMDAYRQQQEAEERRSEILDLSRCLREFDIGFHELAQISPRHADSRSMLMNTGIRLAGEPALMRTLLTKKRLPVKELMELAGLSRKTVERNRKYLITIALVHNGPYPYLREYLDIGLHREMRMTR